MDVPWYEAQSAFGTRVPAATALRCAAVRSAVTPAMTSTPGAVTSGLSMFESPWFGPRDEKPAMNGAGLAPLKKAEIAAVPPGVAA